MIPPSADPPPDRPEQPGVTRREVLLRATAAAALAVSDAQAYLTSVVEPALQRNRAAIGDSEAFYATDVAFHGVLYKVPRNPIYPAVHKAYVDWLMSHWRRMERSSDVDRMNHAGHVAIERQCDRIRRHNVTPSRQPANRLRTDRGARP